MSELKEVYAIIDIEEEKGMPLSVMKVQYRIYLKGLLMKKQTSSAEIACDWWKK